MQENTNIPGVTLFFAPWSFLHTILLSSNSPFLLPLVRSKLACDLVVGPLYSLGWYHRILLTVHPLVSESVCSFLNLVDTIPAFYNRPSWKIFHFSHK